MLRKSFEPVVIAEYRDRPVEGVLTAFHGPVTRMDWPFYFCTLRLDSGEMVNLSVDNWDTRLAIGQRVHGYMHHKGLFTEHEAVEALKPAKPPSVFKRLKTTIAQKFGR